MGRSVLFRTVGVVGAASVLGIAAVGGTALHARRSPERLRQLAAGAVLEGGLLPALSLGLLTTLGDPPAERARGLVELEFRPGEPAAGRAWLERAARKGDALAAWTLAGSLRAEGAPAERVAPWLELAAEGGVASAQGLLGALYREGAGPTFPPDPARALKHFRLGAERSDPLSLQSLAEALRVGELGLAVDAEQAASLARELEHTLRERGHEHGAERARAAATPE